MKKVIGIGEMAISNNHNDTIKTFALGSCVGITAYSPLQKVGGIIHIALPRPARIEDANKRYCYYATTGVPYFIHQFSRKYGCAENELVIRIFGGANSTRQNDTFNVGKRNLEIIQHILNDLNLKIRYAEIGETVSRTIELEVGSGDINIWHQKMII
ncbi:chemotaxis protein CheD [Acetobacterium woodii]|uniref:Chemotaxis protein deaminase CheD1 n=1 Tax=Acetobacterium woodii (strain ATCC 29683 / DSM 1030 / JCM 2381 / KCTC 1655 / WB1) TaxID=931626 RepID=H6LG14_ACEWD|nr:chemotaxis protein CheD [Acetobacterium woodii]AFA48302.1 chemotaxis protein deaminase CheD1 [Acetobacterium woodii DSM 1030]